MDLTLFMYLIPSLIMFGCGVYGFITRKNMIAIMISLELMLNSVDINFAVFNRYLFPGQMDGMFFSLFAIGIAAAETALALAIIINVFRIARNVDINMEKIGQFLLSTDKFGYLLPFEAISVLLLACIIGGVVIARRR